MKFRLTKRLIEWMDSREGRKWRRENKESEFCSRLPPETEAVFFKSKEDATRIAMNVSRYAHLVGRLPREFEQLLKPSKQAITSYMVDVVERPYEGEALELVNLLQGSSNHLVSLARHKGRLPEHLELSISTADAALEYAIYVLKGRLPSALEELFFQDADLASKYAFKVIRGFAPCRLPDALHSFMVMKSFEETDNEEIKEYIQACHESENPVCSHA